MSVFQTNTFVDGVWTTRTVDADAVLRAWQDEQPVEKLDLDLGKPPVYGLLSKTVVNSPVVHWILPARIRSDTKNDIVFIGVCVCEFLCSIRSAFSSGANPSCPFTSVKGIVHLHLGCGKSCIDLSGELSPYAYACFVEVILSNNHLISA